MFALPRSRASRKKSSAVFEDQFSARATVDWPDPGNPLLGRASCSALATRCLPDVKPTSPRRRRNVTKRKLKFVKTEWPVAETRLSFTLGKGGVGKTTITAALAFHSRSLHKDVHVTVCSTDPAPSLDDVFEKEIEDKLVSVLGDPGLGAMEMDAVFEFRRWAARIKSSSLPAPAWNPAGCMLT